MDVENLVEVHMDDGKGDANSGRPREWKGRCKGSESSNRKILGSTVSHKALMVFEHLGGIRMRKLTTRGQPSCPSPYTFDPLRGMGSRVAAGPWVVAGGVSSPGSPPAEKHQRVAAFSAHLKRILSAKTDRSEEKRGSEDT